MCLDTCCSLIEALTIHVLDSDSTMAVCSTFPCKHVAEKLECCVTQRIADRPAHLLIVKSCKLTFLKLNRDDGQNNYSSQQDLIVIKLFLLPFKCNQFT